MRVKVKEFIKIGFPKKINKGRQLLLCFLPVVMVLKMVSMKKFYMLHDKKMKAGGCFYKTFVAGNLCIYIFCLRHFGKIKSKNLKSVTVYPPAFLYLVA